jgi:hypothetical protein
MHGANFDLSSSKKIYLRQVFSCLRPRSIHPPPPPYQTVYVYNVNFFTQKRGGELNQREC